MKNVYEFRIAFGSSTAVNKEIEIASKYGWELAGDASVKITDDFASLYVPLKRLIKKDFSNTDAIQFAPDGTMLGLI